MGRGPVSLRMQEHASFDASVFLDALEAELRQLPAGFRPETIFIGGGTPTELSDADFRRLFEILRARVDLGGIVEWSCESNPGTLTEAKACILREAGVNRVSLGVQSFDPPTLEFLGRIHSAEEAEAGFHLLRAHGFDNINLDLMYGIPGGTREAVERDLDRLIALGPEHAACYCLIFEDGTPLADLRKKGFVKEVDDETELVQYQLVRDRLAAAGYRHYEISNFARPGRECAHNLLYWGAGEYIGCGPSAHSHWAGERYGNVRDLKAYCERMLGGTSPRAFTERLDPAAKARETLVMALRRRDGVSRDAFRQATGYDYRQLCGETMDWLTREGLLEETGTGVRLTDQGLFLSDGVFAELV
jgi:oxygen-independent coproporphyrinogen-3 oxidase